MARYIFSYLLGGSIFFVAIPAIIFFIATLCPYTFMPEGKVAVFFGAFSSAVGLLFMIWSNLELIKKGKGGAVVIGNIKISKETIKLVTTGPYSMCRNPMHMGAFLFYLGLCCAVNSFFTLVVPFGFLLFAYFFAVFLDEPRLKRDFPEDYEKWIQDVPQRFWPKPKKG